MTLEAVDAYPGESAQPGGLLALADEFRTAAHQLGAHRRRGAPLSVAPYRFNAIHAVELYLSAILLQAGHEPGKIRGLQHDLAARADLAVAGGLILRKRTAAHLKSMSGAREYVVTRYSTEAPATLSQVNRIAATLDEVASKSAALIGAARQEPTPKAGPQGPSPGQTSPQ